MTVRFLGQDYPPDTREIAILNQGVDDLGPLAELVELRVLRLVRTDRHRIPIHTLTDLSPLRGLVHLEVLELPRTPVEDLSPLAGLERLRRLVLRGTDVADLSPLEGLGRLAQLDVRDARVPRAEVERFSVVQPSAAILAEWGEEPSGADSTGGEEEA